MKRKGSPITVLWLTLNCLPSCHPHFVTFVKDTKYISYLILFIQCQYIFTKWNKNLFPWSTCWVAKDNKCLFLRGNPFVEAIKEEGKTLSYVATSKFYPALLPLYPAKLWPRVWDLTCHDKEPGYNSVNWRVMMSGFEENPCL